MTDNTEIIKCQFHSHAIFHSHASIRTKDGPVKVGRGEGKPHTKVKGIHIKKSESNYDNLIHSMIEVVMC